MRWHSYVRRVPMGLLFGSSLFLGMVLFPRGTAAQGAIGGPSDEIAPPSVREGSSVEPDRDAAVLWTSEVAEDFFKEVGSASPEPATWQLTLLPQYRFERSLCRRADYYRIDPILTTPVGAFGGQYDKGMGKARIVPVQWNVFGSETPLPWLDGVIDTWVSWYGMKLPDEHGLEAGFLGGYWGQDGGTEKQGQVGSQSIHVRGPFLFGRMFRKQPWGRGEGLDFFVIESEAEIDSVVPELMQIEGIRHTDSRLELTYYSRPSVDLFGIWYRVREDHTFDRRNTPPTDPLPGRIAFDATEYRVGPGIRCRYGDEGQNSISLAPMFVRGQSTGGYIRIVGEELTTYVYEDWSAAGEFSNLDLSDSYGVEVCWETPDFLAAVNLVNKHGRGTATFPGPLLLPPPIGQTTGLYGFHQDRDELFVRTKWRLKSGSGRAPAWYHRLCLEPTYRRVSNRGYFTVDAPVLAGMGLNPRVQSRRNRFGSELYYLGVGIEKLWRFDRAFLGFGRDRVEHQDYGWAGVEMSF